MPISAELEAAPRSWGLVADSDPQRAQRHRHLLEPEGLEVFVARDGEQARVLVQNKGAPKLALVELALARIDGFALIELIRSRAPRAEAKVIALSAIAALRNTAQQRQAELGLSGLLASWASVDVVKRAVGKALAETEAAPRPPPAPTPALDDAPPDAPSEAERLRAIDELGLRGAPPSEELQQIVEKVARRFGVSASFISIILKDHQWLSASTGVKGRLLEEQGVSRSESFCTHVVQGAAPLVVPDAALHPFFSQNPLVKEGLLRSYAGAPLVTQAGAVLGSLCIIDVKPMNISARDVDELVVIARQVAGELELSRVRREQAAGKRSPFVSAKGEEKAGVLGTWFDTVLDNIAEGVLVLDEERNIVVASSAAARLLQTPVRELMGKHREALLKELAPQFADADGFVRQLRVSPSGPYVLRAQLLTRQKRLLRWVTRPVLLGKGHGHLIVLSDVTPAPAPG